MEKKLFIATLLGAFLGLSAFLFVVDIVKSETNIDSINRHAWSDVSGWWDFYEYQNVNITGAGLSGYASSSIGEISLDCATSPNGNVCGSSNYRVTNPSADGLLSGCAWNDEIGWTSFWCGDVNCDGSGVEDPGSTCVGSSYRVTIDANGNLQGYAWNEIEGWISFNCGNHGGCGNSNYKVQTSWQSGKRIGILESSIFDTNIQNGTTLNSIIWQGAQSAGTCVKFQIAAAENQNGPWNYVGPDIACDGAGDENEYFGAACPGPNVAIEIKGCDRNWIKSNQYLRYKVFLESNFAQNQTPVIDNVILNWSK